MRLSWKTLVLVCSVAFHLVLFAILKVPVILARSPQVALIFNFSEPPKIEQPKPEPPKPELPKIEEKQREEKKPEPKNPDEPPPPPKAPEQLPSDLVDDGRPVLNPEPGGVPEGEAGGVPGGTPGGTGTAEPAPVPPREPDPSPPPEPEKPKVDTDAILAKYSSSVKSKVQSAKFYPEQAKRMEHEGSVKVRFTVTASGGVSGVSVASSSGFSDLDSAAVQAVQNAAPFGVIPEELGKSSLTMTVTLKYRLN